MTARGNLRLVASDGDYVYDEDGSRAATQAEVDAMIARLTPDQRLALGLPADLDAL